MFPPWAIRISSRAAGMMTVRDYITTMPVCTRRNWEGSVSRIQLGMPMA